MEVAITRTGGIVSGPTAVRFNTQAFDLHQVVSCVDVTTHRLPDFIDQKVSLLPGSPDRNP